MVRVEWSSFTCGHCGWQPRIVEASHDGVLSHLLTHQPPIAVNKHEPIGLVAMSRDHLERLIGSGEVSTLAERAQTTSRSDSAKDITSIPALTSEGVPVIPPSVEAARKRVERAMVAFDNARTGHDVARCDLEWAAAIDALLLACAEHYGREKVEVETQRDNERAERVVTRQLLDALLHRIVGAAYYAEHGLYASITAAEEKWEHYGREIDQRLGHRAYLIFKAFEGAELTDLERQEPFVGRALRARAALLQRADAAEAKVAQVAQTVERATLDQLEHAVTEMLTFSGGSLFAGKRAEYERLLAALRAEQDTPQQHDSLAQRHQEKE